MMIEPMLSAGYSQADVFEFALLMGLIESLAWLFKSILAIRRVGLTGHVYFIQMHRIRTQNTNLAVAEFHLMGSSAERHCQHGSAEGISAAPFFYLRSSGFAGDHDFSIWSKSGSATRPFQQCPPSNLSKWRF